MKKISEVGKHNYSDRMLPKNRLEALTDGVFAIVMTILVLSFDVSKIGNISSSTELWEILSGELGMTFISFVESFLLLGSMWAIHAKQFNNITAVDRKLTSINTLRLLVVTLIPFTSSLSGMYPNILLATILFPINFMLLTILSTWQWRYAISNKSLYNYENITKNKINEINQKNMIYVFASVLVVIFSIFIGSFAFLIFLLAPILNSYILKKQVSQIYINI